MWNSLKEIGLNCFFLCVMCVCCILSGNAQCQDSVQRAFSYQANDSLSVEVYVAFQDRSPVFYFSHLETGVCSDGLCKPLNMTVKWDLLGNFLSYQTAEFHPLTKFDHIEMTKEDHEQLHAILSDTASILRDYYVEDMIDTRQEVYSIKVDAVTRPTSKTFENVTVEGALYTVYTLWHFVNGGIRKVMFEYTSTSVEDPMIHYMLQSDNRDYVKYILEQDNPAIQWDRFIPNIIALISHSDAYIPHFALAKLQDSTLMDAQHQVTVVDQLIQVDDPVKNAMLTRFETIPLHSESIATLITNMYTMHTVQVQKVTQILYNNRNRLTETQRSDLRGMIKTGQKELADVVGKLLRRIE